MWKTKENTDEYQAAATTRADRWVPACGGHEQPFEAHGTRWQYMYNPGTGQHAYMNLDTDIIEEFPPFLV